MKVQAHKSEGIGLEFPERKDDGFGRPSWYSYQIQVDALEDDAPDPVSLRGRQLTLPPAPEPPSWL